MTRRLITLPALLLVLAACGGSGRGAAAPAGVGSNAPSAGAGTAAASSTPGPGSGASHAGPSAGPSTGVPGRPRAGSSGGPGSTSAPGHGSATPAGTSGPAGAAPGSYTLDSSGTVNAGAPETVNGTATLTEDPVRSGTQHSLLKGDRGSTEETVAFEPDGAYLNRLALTNAAFSKTFEPSPHVLLLPSPQTAGRHWTWQATSTDGKTTASTTNTVGGHETLTIGSEAVDCVVVNSVLTLSGDITYRAEARTWYSPRYRLVVKDHEKGSGNANGFPFSSDVTSVMRSTRPS